MNDKDYLSLRNEMLEQVIGLQQDPMRLFSNVKTFGQKRKDILERLDILKGCLRDALVYKETGRMDYLFNQDRAPEIQFFADGHSASDLLKSIRAVDRAYGAIDQNANKSLTLEAMLFRLT